MEHTTIAVDLAKSVFQVAVSHQPGRVDDERRLSRDRFLEFFAQQPRPRSCSRRAGRRTTGRARLQPFGHTVRLLPARRASVRAAQQDRPHRREGAARSRSERGDPPGARQDGRAPSDCVTPSPALHLARDPHRAAQHRPRAAARIRHLHPASARSTSCPGSAKLLAESTGGADPPARDSRGGV